MKLIVGLGNPGKKYEATRHNTGFRVVDMFCAEKSIVFTEKHGKALLATTKVHNERIVLAKPFTFMNLSGESVAELIRWFKLTPKNMLIVCDDLDLPEGRIRMRPQGGSGGQNGLESIIKHLNTNQFSRLRVGIGRPSRGDAIEYVLGTPEGDGAILLQVAEEQAVKSIHLWIEKGTELTMNEVNGDMKQDTSPIKETR
jgi:PTH1 family peptidyl-tRNA hydrolase